MKSVIIIIIAAIFMVSCTKDSEINWDLQSHPDMLVVDGAITNETKQHVIQLSVSNPYFETDKFRPVSNAIVYVTEGNTNYTFKESNDQPGIYFSETEFAGQPSKTYKLNIKLSQTINGLTEYSGTSQMLPGTNLDSMKCEIYEMPEMDNDEDEDEDEEKDTTILAIYYFGNDPAGLPNYFLLKAYRNQQPLQTEARDFLAFESSESNYTHLAMFVKNIAHNDTVTFRLFTINRDYYSYLEAIKNMDQTGNANSMSGPPANAVGNIPKALGYFLATYVSTQKGLAEDKR